MGTGYYGVNCRDPILAVTDSVAMAALRLVGDVQYLYWYYICHRTAKDMQVHDHGSIVWDEFVGMWITLMALPVNSWQWVVAGFIAFRIFDIWKPWPIRWFDRNIHGGTGIMVDDIIAGVVAAAVIFVIGHYWPL